MKNLIAILAVYLLFTVNSWYMADKKERTSVSMEAPEVQQIIKKYPGVSRSRVMEVLAKLGAQSFQGREEELKNALLSA